VAGPFSTAGDGVTFAVESEGTGPAAAAGVP
jgi:hypothetical protein